MSRFLIFLILNTIALHIPLSAQTAPEGASNWRGANMQSENKAGIKTDGALPDLLPAPRGKITLMGGTVRSVDFVRDQLTLQVFGGGKTTLLFDDRTHVYRDGSVASLQDLQTGARVYADTALAGNDIFAKNVRIVTQHPSGQSNGQIVGYEPGIGELLLRDALSPEPVRLRLAPDAMILCQDHPCTRAELIRGDLVSLVFHTHGAGHPVVSHITVLAKPGTPLVFSGKIAHIDMRSKRMVVVDPRDQKSYEISFNPGLPKANELNEGAEVMVSAEFDGTQYAASAITLNSPVAH